MDLPSSLTGESGQRLLLSPFYLLEEICGALIPGLLFTVLVYLKCTRSIVSALALPGLGYKTKLSIVVLLAFFLGKTLHVWVTLLLDRVMGLGKSNQKNQKTLFDKLPYALRILVGGLVLGPLMVNSKNREFEALAVYRSGISLQVCSGVWLIIAAAIPGDGTFRILELFAGVSLALSGIRQAQKMMDQVAMAAGMSLGTMASGQSIEDLTAKFAKAWPVLQALFVEPKPAASSPAKNGSSTTPTTEVASVAAAGSDHPPELGGV